MYRRSVRLLYSSFVGRITPIHLYNHPCPCIRTIRNCHNIPQRPPEWTATRESEEEVKLSFSNLDPDTFGTLSEQPMDINEELDEIPEEPGDVEEFVFRDKEGKRQRRPRKFYYHLIQDLLQQKKIVDAIDVLEVRLKEDGLKPDYHTYNLLISGCAKVGYCSKAFKLYMQMKKNNVKRTPATYTALFNACALSPAPKDALMRLNNLRKNLQDSGVTLSAIHYNAMMKAYARLNDVHSTFQVVDEMLSHEFTLNADTFCSLLQGCISDKENGMRHALLTWHKMRQKKIQTNLSIYNLFIRCIRDCDFGDEDELSEAIKTIIGGYSNSTILLNSGTTAEEDQKLPAAASGEDRSLPGPHSEKPEFTYAEIEMVENRPNLLAKKPYLGTIISLRSVKTPTDRLLLLGGYKNLLKEMEEDGVKPDVKTYTQLLSIMPSTESSEKFLMKEMEKYNVHMDIDFCNMLIKQRALRFDYEGAKNVLSIIQAKYLQPDIVTFGVMAMSCRNKEEVIELILNMKAFSMRLNPEILGTMVHGATVRFNFDLVIYLMKLTRKYRINPNETYMNHLEELNKRVVQIRRDLKKNKPVPPKIERDKNFRENSLVFSDFFTQWKKEVEIFKSPHPYKQFKKPKAETEGVNEVSKRPSRAASKKYSERSDDDVEVSRRPPREASKKYYERDDDDDVDSGAFELNSWKNFRPRKDRSAGNEAIMRRYRERVDCKTDEGR